MEQGGGGLEKRVAIVTGGASGIGKATAERLSAGGADVVIVDVDGDSAQRLARPGHRGIGSIVAATGDISREEAVRAVIAETISRFGRLDILCNNAAAVSFEQHEKDGAVAEMDLEAWNRQLAVTLTGTMLFSKHAIPPMLQAGGGCIINISSASALRGDLSVTAYSAAKAGVNSLTRSIAAAYGPSGIRCNAVAPGLVLTPNTLAKMPDGLLETYRQNVLVPDLAQPADIAGIVAFLASDCARYINGQILVADGGMLSHQPFTAVLRQRGISVTKTADRADRAIDA